MLVKPKKPPPPFSWNSPIEQYRYAVNNSNFVVGHDIITPRWVWENTDVFLNAISCGRVPCRYCNGAGRIYTEPRDSEGNKLRASAKCIRCVEGFCDGQQDYCYFQNFLNSEWGRYQARLVRWEKLCSLVDKLEKHLTSEEVDLLSEIVK